MMEGRQEKQHETWKRLSPEVREALADIAFQSPHTITPEMKEAIQRESLQDLIEQEQGEQ